MTTTRVGLMGFGRVGRDLFRLLYQRDDIEIAAINDIADPKALEYLLKFDTIFGRFPSELSITDGYLYVDGQRIPLLAERDDVPWADHQVDVVVHATGKPTGRELIDKHLDNGAQRVILCVPPTEPPDITVIIGINDDQLRPEHRVISNASSTAHCAAPILRLLDDTFGIERAFLSTVHAYTSKGRLADVPAADKRSGRAAAENIIPQETNAADVIVELMPEFDGKIEALAMNVPVPNGSIIDLVSWHRDEVTIEAINEVVRTAAADSWSRIIDYEHEPIVSSDVLRSPFSSTFDAQGTMVLEQRVSKVLSWFDNSWGYCNRVVDLIDHLAILDASQETAS